jgi:hypothetical protein
LLVDRSALFGVLAQIEALSLELLELRQIRARPTSRESGDDRPPPSSRRSAGGRPGDRPGCRQARGDADANRLAWLLVRCDRMLLIPGTSSIGHLEENMAAIELELDDADLAVLDRVEQRDSGAE